MSSSEGGYGGEEIPVTAPIPKPRTSLKIKTAQKEEEESLRARRFEKKITEDLTMQTEAISNLVTKIENLQQSNKELIEQLIKNNDMTDAKVDLISNKVDVLETGQNELNNKVMDMQAQLDFLMEAEQQRQENEQRRMQEEEEQARIRAEEEEEREETTENNAPDPITDSSPVVQNTDIDVGDTEVRKFIKYLYNLNVKAGPMIILGGTAFAICKFGALFRNSRAPTNGGP